MNTTTKTFAFAVAMSIALLACNDAADLNAKGGDDNSLLPPYPVTIEKDVEKWMEEQLASGSGEKRLISISDGYIVDTQPPGLSAFGRSDSNGEYFVEYSFNDEKISAEEYYRIQEEYRSQINTDKRDLSIPGEIIYESSRYWTVLITAKELAEAELQKKYTDLVIYFHVEPKNDLPQPPGEPIAMDSTVVSYKKQLNNPRLNLGFKYGEGSLILGRDTLELLFPHIFNDKQAESQCDYFALYFSTSSTFVRYWLLSQGIIYELKPVNELCVQNSDIAHHAMLICDDNAGTLRESIVLDSIRSYTVQNWDCVNGGGPKPEDVFF